MGVGVSVTNAYMLYVKTHVSEAARQKDLQKKKGGMPKLSNNEEFSAQLAINMICLENQHAALMPLKASLVVPTTSNVRSWENK